MASNIVLSNTDYKVVGTRPVRHDGTDKVTGRAKYGADFDAAGLLYAKVLRSPHAHARIKSIDTSKAEAAPGVRAVITGADVPTDSAAARKVMAKDKALYKGHPRIRRGRHQRPQRRAGPGPHRSGIRSAEGRYRSPRRYGRRRRTAPRRPDHQRTRRSQRQAQQHRHPLPLRAGRLGAGLRRRRHHRIEKEYSTATVHQGLHRTPERRRLLEHQRRADHLGPGTQGAFTTRDALAGVLDLPVSKVKVVPMEIGGGFGGKIPIYLEPLTALLSKKAGVPGQGRHVPRRGFRGHWPHFRLLYAHQDGRNQRRQDCGPAEAMLAFDAGAFPGSPVTAGAQCMFACYDIENCPC